MIERAFALGFLVAASAAAAELTGTFGAKATMTWFSGETFDKNGAIADAPAGTGSREVTEQWEFRPNHALLFWTTPFQGPLFQGTGAWLLEGDQLFYLIPATSDHAFLGVVRVNIQVDSLRVYGIAGDPSLPILGSTSARLTRSNAVSLDKPEDTAALLEQLQGIVAGIDRSDFEGAASEEELVRRVRAALEIPAFKGLMAVSYPTSGQSTPDERLRRYFAFRRLLLTPLRSTQAYTMAQFFSAYPAWQKNPITFPVGVELKGVVELVRPAPSGRSTAFTPLFYGKVGDSWALLGDPLP